MKKFTVKYLSDPDTIKEKTIEVTPENTAYYDFLLVIERKMLDIIIKGFEPEFILLNKENYNKIVSNYYHKSGHAHLIDIYHNCKIIICDGCADGVEVKTKASIGFLNNL
jgi:hypothetical protein